MAPPITCTCGTCRKCKHRAYMNRYYRANAATMRETARQSRERRIEEVRAYDRERGHRVYDIGRERVRRQTYTAIENGSLTKKPCEVCGSTNVEAHHDDYTKPLEVRWLCRRDHMALHRKVAA